MTLRPVEITASATEPPTPARPPDVAEVQRALNALAGSRVVPETGVIDASTQERLALFQAAHGLTETGEPDWDTVAALRAEADRTTRARASSDETTSRRAPARSEPRVLDTFSLALQQRLFEQHRPQIASASLWVTVESSSTGKWEQSLTEARERTDELSYEVSRRPDLYRAMTAEQRHELWTAIVVTGNTAAGHRILEALRATEMPGASGQYEEAVAELRFAAQRARSEMPFDRAPSGEELAATVNETISGPPLTAAEVEARAVLSGDPPPAQARPEHVTAALTMMLDAHRAADRYRREHGARPGEAAIGAASEVFVPAPGDELTETAIGELLGAPAEMLTLAIDVLEAIGRGHDAHRRASDPEYAFQQALYDVIWRTAEEHPPRGMEHLPVGVRAEAIRVAMIDALERAQAFDQWLSRHPEHPAHPSRR